MAEPAFNPTLKECFERTKAYIDDWAQYYGIYPAWKIEVVLEDAKNLDDAECIAQLNWPNHYRVAKIKLNKQMLMNRARMPSWWHFEAVAAHELLHLIGADLWDYTKEEMNGTAEKKIQEHIETLTDTLTNIIMRTRYGKS